MRSIIERLARGRVIRRKLPSSFGHRPIYLSPDSALSYLKPNWSKDSSELLNAAKILCSRRNCIWDIGANVGVFGVAGADRAAQDHQVVLVEADPFLASTLQRTANEEQNLDLNLNVLCAAISDQCGVEKFLVASRGRSSNSLEKSGQRSQAGGVRYTQSVVTVTLDSMLNYFERPQVLKIDVEGAEAMVLRGGKQLLGEHRPLIYVEVGAEQCTEVTEILKSSSYRLFDGERLVDRPIDRCIFNTLAVPAEQEFPVPV